VCCVDLRYGETPQAVLELVKKQCGARTMIHLPPALGAQEMLDKTVSRGIGGRRRLMSGFLPSPLPQADVVALRQRALLGKPPSKHLLVIFVHFSGERRPAFDPGLSKLLDLQLVLNWPAPHASVLQLAAAALGAGPEAKGLRGRIVLGRDNQRFLDSLAASGGNVEGALRLMGKTDQCGPTTGEGVWAHLRRLGELQVWEQNGGEGRCPGVPDPGLLVGPLGLDACEQAASRSGDALEACWEEADRFSCADGMGPRTRFGRNF
jgi:hypothetical protein